MLQLQLYFYALCRDVTKFVFAFNNMQIFDNFTAIQYSTKSWGISGEYKYFILFNFIELLLNFK